FLLFSCHTLALFALSLLPPPRPPLFPYTTLFRSFVSPRRRFCSSRRSCAALPGFVGTRRRSTRSASRRRSTNRSSASSRLRSWLDRKSTRLNSSHGSISYAVFCLKKKRYTDQAQL